MVAPGRTAPDVGLTGARFAGARVRRPGRPDPRPWPVRRPVDAGPDPAPTGPDPAVGSTGARFGEPGRRRREAGPAPAADPDPVPGVAPDFPRALLDPGPAPDVGRYTIVRPYVLTGGRTRGRVQFAIEALITSRPGRGHPGESVEHARIRELCRSPRSVAEVAALLDVPLGVARVLLADLLAGGAVTVHRTADAGGPDLLLMERVLHGLRRL